MATYLPPKRGVELIFYVGLVSQSDTKTLQANPTLFSGDVKVSKDGGAFANLTTLPTVTPAGGKAVKVTLSATEMEADNLTVVFADASGAEWCDQLIHIATAARQVDDLAYPTVSGRSLDVSAGGEAGVDWANVGSPTTTLNLSGTTVKTATDVETDTADIQTRLPAALTAGGNIKADALAISGDATAADNAEAFFDGTGYAGTGNVIPTVTSVTGIAAGGITASSIATDAIDADALASDAVTEIADGLLKRDWTSVTGEAARSVLNALRFLRNKWSISGSTLTVTKEDDTTSAWTGALTTNASADPVTGNDPS